MATNIQQQLIKRVLSRHFGAAATTAANDTFVAITCNKPHNITKLKWQIVHVS